MGEKGPNNHAIITQQITPEKYLCTIMTNPQGTHVGPIEEVQQFNLFPNDDAMNAFIVARRQPKPEAPKPEVDPTELPPGAPKKKVAKKKAAKKVAKKQVSK